MDAGRYASQETQRHNLLIVRYCASRGMVQSGPVWCAAAGPRKWKREREKGKEM